MRVRRIAVLLAGVVLAGLQHRRQAGSRSPGSALDGPAAGLRRQVAAEKRRKDEVGGRHNRPGWAWDDVAPVVTAADRALNKLIDAGKDRVVFRDDAVRVLRPEHDDYRLRRVRAG